MQAMWWFVAALTLGIAEIFTLDLALLMLAGGAIGGGIAALVGLPLWGSAIIALVVAVLLLFALRPWLLRSLQARTKLVETNAAALVGKSAKALMAVTEDKGRVKLAGEVWSARTEDDAAEIPEGAEVKVVRIQGAIAIVAPQ